MDLNFPKRCKCCGRVYDPESWNLLKYKGRMGDDVEVLELRDCVCGSTLAIKIDPKTGTSLGDYDYPTPLARRAFEWWMNNRSQVGGEPLADWKKRFERRYDVAVSKVRQGHYETTIAFEITPKYGRPMELWERAHSSSMLAHYRKYRPRHVRKVYPVRGGIAAVPEIPGMAFRGMSWEEWLRIRSNQCVRSAGWYNLGDEQRGLTMFGLHASTAEHYATGFAPIPYGPGWKAPGIVIAIPKELTIGPANRPHGIPSGELAVVGCLDVRSLILSNRFLVWAILPVDLTAGDIEVVVEKHWKGDGESFKTGSGGVGSGGNFRVYPIDAQRAMGWRK